MVEEGCAALCVGVRGVLLGLWKPSGVGWQQRAVERRARGEERGEKRLSRGRAAGVEGAVEVEERGKDVATLWQSRGNNVTATAATCGIGHGHNQTGMLSTWKPNTAMYGFGLLQAVCSIYWVMGLIS